jgi:alpha-L-rhamnosidase
LTELVHAKDNHLNTGILGTKYLLDALSENGHEELVYTIVTQKTFPGWGYWIEQGATTMWERWGGISSVPSGQNFTFLTEVDVWFYNYILGIKIIEEKPAYKQFEISPYFFEKLEWAKGKIATMYGDIEVDWSKNGSSISYSVTIPENTSAIFKAPKGYRIKRTNKDAELGSGIHTIILEEVNPSKKL